MEKGTKKTILMFGGLCAVGMLLFELRKWSLFVLGASNQGHVVISGILFLVLGILIGRYFYVKHVTRRKKSGKSSLSPQEMKVLHLMADGLSNREISKELFIAETTVKSHVSKILAKLRAKRRTEAIKIGRELEII